MDTKLTAKSSITIDAPVTQVWEALVNPAAIKEYMFGTDVRTEWREGHSITWSGEWQGKQYEDKGIVQRVDSPHTLRYTHYSPLSGLPDAPENYHTVHIGLEEDGRRTHVALSQDNNPTEQAREHSAQNWAMVLRGLKEYVEARAGMGQ